MLRVGSAQLQRNFIIVVIVGIVDVERQVAAVQVVTVSHHLMVLAQLVQLLRQQPHQPQRTGLAVVQLRLDDRPLLPDHAPGPAVQPSEYLGKEGLVVGVVRVHPFNVFEDAGRQVETVKQPVDDGIEQAARCGRDRVSRNGQPGIVVIQGGVDHPAAQAVGGIQERHISEGRMHDLVRDRREEVVEVEAVLAGQEACYLARYGEFTGQRQGLRQAGKSLHLVAHPRQPAAIPFYGQAGIPRLAGRWLGGEAGARPGIVRQHCHPAAVENFTGRDRDRKSVAPACPGRPQAAVLACLVQNPGHIFLPSKEKTDTKDCTSQGRMELK